MKQLRYLVLHCTATAEAREVTADEIRRWHLSPPPCGRGWHQVGYTDLIHLDGKVERLVDNNEDAWVDDWEITNGAKGYNSVSRHVAYVGGVDKEGKAKDTRTPEQRKSMKRYVAEFHNAHPEVRIVGHNELNPDKECPSFDVQRWLKEDLGLVQ